MTRLLPALHEGHAPIQLHLAFDEAVEAFENWSLNNNEPQILFEDHLVPISAIFGRMRSCSDILPLRTLDLIKEVFGNRSHSWDELETYADAAFVLRALCVERLRVVPVLNCF